MAEIFADTAGWANFFVRTEPFHVEAKHLMQQWYANGERVVTTNYVLLELVALLTRPLRIPREEQVKTIETLQAAAWVEVIHIDSTVNALAWQLLRDRLDKSWSWVDCASFVVMEQRQITRAFTTDRHFEQAGFIRLLK
jgi:predicted nucleic acid-binding protein